MKTDISNVKIIILILSLCMLAMMAMYFTSGYSLFETFWIDDCGVIAFIFNIVFLLSLMGLNIFAFTGRYDMAHLASIIGILSLVITMLGIMFEGLSSFQFDELNFGFYAYMVLWIILLVITKRKAKG